MKLSKFMGCLIGTAIGDSLGAPGEGSFSFIEVSDIAPRYTDDTAMMIGVVESLIECRGFNGEHMARRFIENYQKEPWRGYGWGPPRIFKMISSGRKWDEMLDREIFPGGSFGNGAAMRIAPIGLFYYDDPERLRGFAYQASMITHSHELAIVGAVLQAYAVALAVNIKHLDRYEFLSKLKDFARVGLYQKKLETIERLLDKRSERVEVVKRLGNGIEAINSVLTAIYSFLVNDDFESTVKYAVSLGGDTDTIGAMSGAIAGAYYSIEGIPERWRQGIENRDYLLELAKRLWETREYLFHI